MKMNQISKIMMYLNQLMGLVSSVRSIAATVRMRKNTEMQKAREMLTQQEKQAGERTVA